MRSSVLLTFWIVLLTGLIVGAAADIRAGDDDIGTDGLQRLDLSYLPSDVYAVFITHPQRIGSVPMMMPVVQFHRDMEPEVEIDDVLISAFGVEFKSGEHPNETAQQILAVSPSPDGTDGLLDLPGILVGIFRFAEPIDGRKVIEELSEEKWEEVRHDGHRYYRESDEAFYMPDQRTIVYSEEESLLRKILSQAKSSKPASGPLLDRLRYVDARNDMIGAVMLEPARDSFAETAEEIQEELLPSLAALPTIPDYLEAAVVTVSFTDRTIVKLTLDGKDPESAAEVLALTNGGLDALRKLYDEHRKEILDDAPEVLAKPLGQLIEQSLAGFGAKLQGKQVVLSIRRPAALEAFVASFTELAKSEQ